MLVLYKRNKKTLLIDGACPCDSNVALKHTEKLTKYRLLKDEVHRICGKLKCPLCL